MMLKQKVGILGGILVFAAIIAVVFWNLYRHQTYSAGNTIDAVPADAALIAKINDTDAFVESLVKEIDYREELLAFESISELYDLFHYTDTAGFFSNNPGKGLLDSPVYLSFTKIGKETIAWVFHFSVIHKSHQSQLKTWIEQHLAGKRNYTGFPIYEINPLKGGDLKLFATFQNGILSVSHSSLLIEASIRQQQSGISLANDKDFSAIQKTTSNRADGSLFINFDNIQDFTEPFLAPGQEDIASFIQKAARWSALDIHIKEDGLMVNGFLSPRTDQDFISLFSGVEPRRSTLNQILPSDIKLFTGYNFSDKQQFIGNFEKYINQSENASKIASLEKDFENKTGKPFVESFFEIMDGEMAFACSNFNASNPNEGRYLVFRTKGQAATMPVLKKIQDYYRVSQEPVKNYRVDESTWFPIYRGFDGELNTLIWSNLFPDLPMKYFSFFRNYLIFADSEKTLESFLYNNVLHRTLESHPYYSSFAENFSYEENFFLFAEIPHIFSFIGKTLNPEKFHPTREQQKVLFNFYAAGIQLSNSSGLNYTTMYAKHAPHRDKEPRTIWQSRIDSMVSIKPALVDNHYTQEKEIMVQDAGNNLYLINNMGRVLWKKPLDGPIMSEIYQIDFYRNNKLQYLFNTPTKLYLLDRNGNHVAKYPFSLPEKASSGLSVFDYDSNRDYRIFLPLNDRKVYLFDKTGARVPGWNIPQTEGIVSQPVQFFRSSGSDYIIFSDKYRNYIMDRRGNNRVTPQKSFVRNSKSPFFIEHPNSENAALVTTTTTGELAKIIVPSGRTIISNTTNPEDPSHSFVLLHQNDPKYVIITPQQITIFNSELKQTAAQKTDKRIQTIGDVYQFSATDHKIGLISEDSSLIYLYNSDGSLYKGFPLKGTSRFSIGFLKSSAYRFNLITGGENNYIYNYRVE
ncbi:DUF3352 domain-containing protein [Marinilabilia sp.]|uniref:DUF3352 domain-containing protein n=1 Tax=Marinilabilia sp. TaxID=2021252 RepID=UPI0025BFFC7D|nr:DUF3352 domain-containing protein [Marinilabilia sp.]